MFLDKAQVKYSKWFDTLYLTKDIKKNSVKGGVNTVAAQLLSFAMTVLSTMVIGRLVSPSSFGLVAMVTVVTGFVVIFKDFGFSSAVIQKESVNHGQVSTLFWINVLITLVISLIVFGASPWVVAFYSEPRLLHITWAFAFSIFIAGFGLQHNALMKRQMKFGRLSIIQIISTSTSIIIGILMAWYGYNYWAIVAIPISFSVTHTFLLWVFCDWRPSLRIRGSNVKEFIRFGMGITGFDVVNYFARNADKSIIGRYIGASALGLYDRSYQLLLLPITQLRVPLNSVAIPALSALKNDHEQYQRFYRRYLYVLAFFSMPLVVFLAVFSEEIILLVLGSQWIEAASIFKLLAIASFIQPVAGTTGVVMITMGLTKRYFTWGVVSAVCTVFGYMIGVRWGLHGIALSYVIVNYGLLVPCLFYCFRYSPITVSLFFKEIVLVIIFSLFSGTVCILAKHFFLSDWHTITSLVTGFLIGATSFLALWFVSPRTKAKFDEILNMRNMVKV